MSAPTQTASSSPKSIPSSQVENFTVGADSEPALPADAVSLPATQPPLKQRVPTSGVNHAQSGTTSPTTIQRAFQQSLNRENLEEEVGQVIGTLNSWWGGVKKQSASALSNIKADLDKTVSQAQADLEYLRTAKVEVIRKDSADFEAEQQAERAKKAAAKAVESKDKGKGKEKEGESVANTTTNAFLNRLTSSTTQLQQSLQSTLQTTLAAAASNPALSNPAALRTQLAENLRLSSAKENLQLSVKQAEKLAEEYLRKSDQWVKDAERWVEDAVKVIPPEGEESRLVSMGWDGGDWYSFSTSSSAPKPSSNINKSVDADVKSRSSSIPALALASSRKDALLRRLREDKELLLVDPEGQDETEERKEEFREWIEAHWAEQKTAGQEQEEGNVGAIRMDLVPEHLTDDQFWQRYLFHKHMIEAEEKKRKLLLQATQQDQQDDFDWDDEPDDSTSPNTVSIESAVSTGPETTPKIENDGRLPSSESDTVAKPAASTTSASTSPRDSEESYDLVSDQGAKAVKTAPPPDDDDSDWE
ncbi:hypothetical protein IAR55_006495 [Kwoniella newhampshirensis]|uniref:BSD domain-containing protein n=1 Tax=Kwoniella newhampshirensis TaxID=1651941 RepID=A0AAW0YIT5_9TREE